MRRLTLCLVALTLALPVQALTPRARCRRACQTRIRECVADGTRGRACKRLFVNLCHQQGVAACDMLSVTTSTITTSTTTTRVGPGSSSTSSTTLFPGSRTDVFPFTDAYGNVATLTVDVDMRVPVIHFTEAVEAGDFLRSEVGEFRQVVGVNSRTWSIGTTGNVIRVVGSQCACSYPIHCVAGDVWCQSYGPPWPVAPGGQFDPAQPFVIIWQNTPLYVE